MSQGRQKTLPIQSFRRVNYAEKTYNKMNDMTMRDITFAAAAAHGSSESREQRRRMSIASRDAERRSSTLSAPSHHSGRFRVPGPPGAPRRHRDLPDFAISLTLCSEFRAIVVRSFPPQQSMRQIKILSTSTPLPNAAQPSHGVCVENRLRHLLQSGGVEG
jgi:hypothetical protein